MVLKGLKVKFLNDLRTIVATVEGIQVKYPLYNQQSRAECPQ